MKIYFLLLSLLTSQLSFSQTRTHPGGGGPDPIDFNACGEAVNRAEVLQVEYLKANKKDFKDPKERFLRVQEFEKFIALQNLKLDLQKMNGGSLSECVPAPSSEVNEKILTSIISLYEGNKRCLDFVNGDELVKQMKQILKHERRD